MVFTALAVQINKTPGPATSPQFMSYNAPGGNKGLSPWTPPWSEFVVICPGRTGVAQGATYSAGARGSFLSRSWWMRPRKIREFHSAVQRVPARPGQKSWAVTLISCKHRSHTFSPHSPTHPYPSTGGCQKAAPLRDTLPPIFLKENLRERGEGGIIQKKNDQEKRRDWKCHPLFVACPIYLSGHAVCHCGVENT